MFTPFLPKLKIMLKKTLTCVSVVSARNVLLNISDLQITALIRTRWEYTIIYHFSSIFTTLLTCLNLSYLHKSADYYIYIIIKNKF